MADDDSSSTGTDDEIDTFITRWQNSGAAERSNYALFLAELCDLLGVARPDPSSEHNAANDYVIDRAFTRNDRDGKSSTVYLDLYKRGHFVLETKQGSSGDGDKLGHGKRGTSGWDKALEKAYHQARGYIRDLPADHGRPPFLIVVDVGHCFDLYAEFTGTGGTYLAFPNPSHRRIFLEDLKRADTRELLRTIWTDPQSLDPATLSAKVTRDVAGTLAQLAASLEKAGHHPEIIAIFLQRVLFTLFAEDVGLLPEKSFEKLLEQTAKTPRGFVTLVTSLWNDMARGTDFSSVILEKVIHFNGGLFENPSALPLDAGQIDLLVAAAKQDWREVEPAIFGTLLERALDPRERHKLGAHYTPRSYVERLIEPTLMQPLREQWHAVKTAAAVHHDAERDDKARAEIEKYHQQLCSLKILDPACGSGNFLYVALARLKELEAEVLDLLEQLGGDRTLEMDSSKVRPSQFLGIELNARAAAIAQLVLWIGYFQWHHKTTGKADTNDRPLLQSADTIECRDAVLAYDERIPRRDPDSGEYLTVWDGRTTKPHPVTGKEVPDESAREELFDYTNPRRTEWPEADYIVGNPPFLGASRMRDGLGDGYVEALRKAWKKFKPNSWDFVMFWWHQAAEKVRDGKSEAFGLITTNSIHQTFNRRCLEPFLSNDKKPVSLVFAIPDHPWVDSAAGAAVRIAMTVARAGNLEGRIVKVLAEYELEDGEHGVQLASIVGSIAANLKTGAKLTSALLLESNLLLAAEGVKPHGMGFVLSRDQASDFGDRAATHIKPYKNGRDVVQKDRDVFIIDLHGLSEIELKERLPDLYQHVYINVRPDRLTNNEKYRRENWWLFGRKNTELRNSIEDLNRYLVTVKTAKHRVFQFVEHPTLPDSKLICISLSGAQDLAFLSSTIHCLWTFNIGARLGAGNDPTYVVGSSFNKFPFPDLTTQPDLTTTLRTLGEKLDSHRKARQAEHPELTLTGIYNVLEKLRLGTPLSDKERVIHDQGLVTLLKQIHDDIDRAVLEAYGWVDELAPPGSAPIADRLAAGGAEAEALEQAILQRLVDLNHERAAEEAQGKIRYLRPDFQDPDGTQRDSAGDRNQAQEQTLDLPAAAVAKIKAVGKGKPKWPKSMPEQVIAVRDLLVDLGTDPELLSAAFGRASKKRQSEIDQILTTLAALGHL